jgi:hypothetical protein
MMEWSGLSKQAFVTVQRRFRDEAARSFGFLGTEFGFAGPEMHGVALPVVSFVGSGVRYRIMLDAQDQLVVTRVDVDLGRPATRLTAKLEDLVQAAGVGVRNHVALSARSLKSLRRALESQARFVRLLQPYVGPGGIVDLMRKANAREWSGP